MYSELKTIRSSSLFILRESISQPQTICYYYYYYYCAISLGTWVHVNKKLLDNIYVLTYNNLFYDQSLLWQCGNSLFINSLYSGLGYKSYNYV